MDQSLFNKQIASYINWNIDQVQNRCNISISNLSDKILPALDVPMLEDKNNYQEFFKVAKDAGYKYLNIGLTALVEGEIALEILKLAKKFDLDIVSAHGTSIKRMFKHAVNYEEILKKDLKVLDIIDPLKKMVINYDLFAGHLEELHFYQDFEKTCELNNISLMKALGLTEKKKYGIPEYIIKKVSNVFCDTKRKITFEIPGTKGWSMISGVDENYLRFLDGVLDEIFPNAFLTLDLAHLLTWSKDEKYLSDLLNVLEFFKKRIAMVHISSMGSDNEQFINLYKIVHKNMYPLWHISGLDVSMFVFEKEMIIFLNRLRNIIGHEYIEVSETRLPSATINDYFPEFYTKKFDYLFEDGLLAQSKILGYI